MISDLKSIMFDVDRVVKELSIGESDALLLLVLNELRCFHAHLDVIDVELKSIHEHIDAAKVIYDPDSLIPPGMDIAVERVN